MNRPIRKTIEVLTDLAVVPFATASAASYIGSFVTSALAGYNLKPETMMIAGALPLAGGVMHTTAKVLKTIPDEDNCSFMEAAEEPILMTLGSYMINVGSFGVGYIARVLGW